MNMKKKLICTLMALSLLLIFTTSAMAESSPIYGAGTCHIGFTTSRYLDRAGSWGDNIIVYNYYVIWDNMWEFDFYQLTYAKNGNVRLSDTTTVFTGMSSQNGGGPVGPGEIASTNRSIYTPLDTEIYLYSNAQSYSKIYLRIEKPNDANYLNDYKPIDNMTTWGWFTKAN